MRTCGSDQAKYRILQNNAMKKGGFWILERQFWTPNHPSKTVEMQKLNRCYFPGCSMAHFMGVILAMKNGFKPEKPLLWGHIFMKIKELARSDPEDTIQSQQPCYHGALQRQGSLGCALFYAPFQSIFCQKSRVYRWKARDNRAGGNTLDLIYHFLLPSCWMAGRSLYLGPDPGNRLQF